MDFMKKPYIRYARVPIIRGKNKTKCKIPVDKTCNQVVYSNHDPEGVSGVNF